VSVTPPAEPAGEVRVTEYARRAARRWYVIVIAIVAAVLLVFLHGVSGATNTSTAAASVYLGQPLSLGGGQVINGTPFSNTNISVNYVTSPIQIAKAAKAAGIDHRSLRRHVSVIAQSPAGTAKSTTGGSGPPTITITVEGPWTRLKVQRAANTLASSLIGFANRYTSLKARSTAARIAVEKHQLAMYAEVQRRASNDLAAIDKSSGSPLEKAAAEAPFVTAMGNAATQIGTLTTALTNDQTSLAATKDIESASFIARAAGRRVTATTRRNSLVIAAMVGLIVGVALALAWEALRARRQPGQA
jgi:hypothetical protein